ncbi:uncharacterized protein LOC121800694 [Salvia splendens]|uniref:uncharacterized protein LOC121800694 n=1 Tax=Salvia splendens TaxID=180675 RepID=UPI0011032417|nr:uncharacterized protein LOC121800694 [Salvia splendens]
MKASIKFRDEQTPLLRAKIPLNIMNFPFQSGVSAGDSKDLSLNLRTFLDCGPSIKFSYRPNDSQKPFSFVFKTGIWHFGSPSKSPLVMSAEFNLVGNQNPTFFIHFKPDLGDFSLKKSHSSASVKNLGEKLNAGREDFVDGNNFNGNGFFPAAESKKAGIVVDGLLKGAELTARTSVSLRDFAMVNLRWGFRVPPREAAEDMDAVVVSKAGDRMAGIRLPYLVMDKIGIEQVARADSKKEKLGPAYNDVAEACLGVKKQLEVIQAENGLLSRALIDLRSDVAAGKMNVFSDHHLSKYAGGAADGRGDSDKTSIEKEAF